ncbi:UPF0606 protein KIAA1549 [Aplochiton taeniatus]
MAATPLREAGGESLVAEARSAFWRAVERADSPVPPEASLGGVPSRGEPPPPPPPPPPPLSALPASHRTPPPSVPSPDALPSRPTPTRNHAVDPSPRDLAPSLELKALTSADPLSIGSAEPVSTPPLSSSDPIRSLSGGLSRLSRGLKPAGLNSTQSTSSPLPVPVLQPRADAHQVDSSAPTASSPPQLLLPNPVHKAPDQPPLAPGIQEVASKQPLTPGTSLPVRPIVPPKLPLINPEITLDPSRFLSYVPPDLMLQAKPSSRTIMDPNQLSPSRETMLLDQPAQGIQTHLKPPPQVLDPGYLPLLTPHPSLATSPSTTTPLEDFSPTDTGDVDWGSGDYLETMSFLGSEGDEFSLSSYVPSDLYDLEDSVTESYDTAFPSRVGVSPSSMLHPPPAPSLVLTRPPHPSSSSSSLHLSSAHLASSSSSLRPSSSSSSRLPLGPTPTPGTPDQASDIDWSDRFSIEPTDLLLPDMNSVEFFTDQVAEGNRPGAEHRGNVTVTRRPSALPVSPGDVVPTGRSTSGVSEWTSTRPTPTLSAGLTSSSPLLVSPIVTAQPDDDVTSSSLTDVLWFASTADPEPTASDAFTTVSTATAPTVTSRASQPTPNVTAPTTEPTSNVTLVPPFMGDQGFTSEPATEGPSTTSPSDSPVPTTPFAVPTTQTAVRTTTTTSLPATTPRQYLCNITRPSYLVRVGFPSAATIGYAIAQVKDILKVEFNKSVELQVVEPPPKFVFRVASGPVVYTAISVTNALRKSGRRFMSVGPNWPVPDHKYQVHSVLQFVPSHIDVRACNFSERLERGLTLAYAEVCRRSLQSSNFTVHMVNITTRAPRARRGPREPVDLTFVVRGARSYLPGSEVSNQLMTLNMVEFSYYMGFPVLQIAEPFHYPELNTSQLLRSSWVRTVLLGVIDQRVGERVFQAMMERRLALLLGEALGNTRHPTLKRATKTGNNSVQIVSTTRLVGPDLPLEMVYFVEGPGGVRVSGVATAARLNGLDVQRAAIVLGYRVQGILAQPVEKGASPPSDEGNTNLWIVVGVVVPLLVVVLIISILYWKLCRTDKLEFQPDAMTTGQQRQKLQAPSVKGFDFAKLHLGQHSKDDLMVIQEPGPGPGPHPPAGSEIGEAPTPKSKTSTSSAKASRSARRRGRISPSDGDSMGSERSSEGRDSTEDSLRAVTSSGDGKQPRKIPINVLNGPPPMNGTDEQLSSAAIFEHVDRMARSADGGRRLPNKIQLIAMQPMPVPPLQGSHINGLNGRVPDTKEMQVALRHKSEIEHHRNKIRLRAKRKGHYDFPTMDEPTDGGPGDPGAKEQDRIYQRARLQIDKILDPDIHMPSIFTEPRKSGRGRSSPRQRRKHQLNGHLSDADKDHLISNDNDGTYRKHPGVSNVAFVSDPDQGPDPGSPSPTDDVFLGPGSPPLGHAPPPPPYMPPQPSIEEARQQMHSLLDDAFALVSPTSQGGTTPGITLPGVAPNGSSPPARGPRPLGSAYPAHSPFPGRYTELGMSPPSVHSLLQRQGLGSSFLPPGETLGPGDQPQPEGLYSNRGVYSEELPSSARPRPVGGTAGAQLHHITSAGLSGRTNGYPAGGGRVPVGQNGSVGWNPYHDDHYRKDELLGYPDYTSSFIFQSPRGPLREPSAPPAHLEAPGLGYSSGHDPPDTSPPSHSSASLIKAIREELLRLSQKQTSVPSYHS